MGHKGPVLRPRCIGPGRARTQIQFNSNWWAIIQPAQWTTSRQQFLTCNILYSSFLYHLTRIVIKTILFLAVEWPQNIVSIFVFLLLPPWRWPHEILKHVGGHCVRITVIKPTCIFWSFLVNLLHLINAWNMWYWLGASEFAGCTVIHISCNILISGHCDIQQTFGLVSEVLCITATLLCHFIQCFTTQRYSCSSIINP